MLRGAGKILLYRGGAEPLGGARKSRGAEAPLDSMMDQLKTRLKIERMHDTDELS